ncbi:amino acid transporter, partial [Sporormia fimetaria CBS 119925]
QRYINQLGILNFGFTLQAAWEGIGLTANLIFINGGPVALVWGTLISGIGHTAIAASLGEMASMDPTVGAQYRWSARFALRYPEFWGLMQGKNRWITTFAWVVTAAGPVVLPATATQAIVGFYNQEYTPKQWHTTLLMWAYLCVAVFCNLYMRRILNTLETASGAFHFLFYIVCIAILTTMAERPRKEARFVFGELISGVSGWENPGVAFHLGLLTTIFPLLAYDSILHMVDETQKPRERVPRAMVYSVSLNSIMAFGYVICLMFCVGDVEKVSVAPQPILEIYYQATKSKGAATTILVGHIYIILVSISNCFASSSRLVWAFAKDGGLPFRSYFSRIHPTLEVPLYALGLVSLVCILLSLINLGSSVALSAILSIPTVALFVSYFIPIFHLVMRKLSGKHPRYGSFRFGRWGLPINLFSLCFCAWAAFWTAFPSSYPVRGVNMNYAGPAVIGLVLLALVDWSKKGKERFVVPTGVWNIEIDDGSEEADGRKGE